MSDINFEHLIISSTLYDQDFVHKTIDVIEPEHFDNQNSKLIYSKIKKHVEEFNKVPSKTELDFDIKSSLGEGDEDRYNECIEFMSELKDFDTEVALKHSEDYIRERAIHNALFKSLEIIEDRPEDKGQLPSIMEEAINISFEKDFGLDYYYDIDDRMKSYDEEAEKIPWKLSMLNKITNGGFERGTLNVPFAPSGFGKSINIADDCLFQADRGMNCIYFTFEMSDKRIAKRLDSNHLDIKINEVKKYKESLREKFERQKSLAKGRMFLKEYPPGCITPSQLSNYVKELEMKKKIVIDVVYVDYINLLASSRYQANAGTYLVIKGIAEELVGLAKKHNVAVISPSQFNRSGQATTSPDVSMVSESQALTNTADFMYAMFDTPELAAMNRACFKQLKNRYGDMNYYNTFIVGIDRSKMRFYDVDETESNDLVNNSKEEKIEEFVMKKKPAFGNFENLT